MTPCAAPYSPVVFPNEGRLPASWRCHPQKWSEELPILARQYRADGLGWSQIARELERFDVWVGLHTVRTWCVTQAGARE